MVAQYVVDLTLALSPDRLSQYRPQGGDDLAMVTTYFWNIALCQALYPCLGTLEVAMRNGIHQALGAHFEQADWYDRPNLLQRREQRMLATAKREIREAKRAEIQQGINPVTPGRVVAALRFGFWTSLLDALYGNSPKGPQLWVSPNSPLLAAAFPHAPVSYRPYRARVHRRFDELRSLRNRVFHYEPIWHRMDLATKHEEILDAIGWVSPTLQATVRHLDRFRNVHRDGYPDIERAMKDYIGIP